MKRRWLVAVLTGAAFAVSMGCGEDPAQPTTGILTVSVYDRGNPDWPVPDVRVELTPSGTALVTNSHGLAVFELGAGEYFVDARVCCIGPGLIEHHVAVTVEPGKRTEISLWACLPCLAAMSAL